MIPDNELPFFYKLHTNNSFTILYCWVAAQYFHFICIFFCFVNSQLTDVIITSFDHQLTVYKTTNNPYSPYGIHILYRSSLMYGALLSYGSDGRHNPRIAYVTTCQGSVTGWQTISALKSHMMNCSKSLIIYLRISYRQMWSGVHIYDISKNFRQTDRWLEAVWYENINKIFKYPISRLRKYARLCETFRRKLRQDGRALVIPP